MNKLKVVGYLRISTDKQIQETDGLDIQRQRIVSYCNDNNLELIKIYSDEGISGAKEIYERPALRQLLDDCKNPPVQHVIVDKADRLSRDFGNQLYIEKQLLINKVTVLFATNETTNINSKDTDMDIIMKTAMRQLMGVFAELDRKMIKKRLTDGLINKAQKGSKPAGRQPFGYKYSQDGKSTEVNKKEARVVLDIFNLRAAGKTFLQITDHLNTYKYRECHSVCFDRKWNHKTIMHMLNNDYYNGTITFSGKKFEGNHEDIISDELWDAVQRVNKKNSKYKD